MARPHTPTHCHCGANRNGVDHCPECGCEEYESVCSHESDFAETTVTWTFVNADGTPWGGGVTVTRRYDVEPPGYCLNSLARALM